MSTDPQKTPVFRGPSGDEPAAANDRDAASEPEPTPLQRRLEALIDSERGAQEMLEELREQRREADQRDVARRVGALEEALAEARAEAAKRAEIEGVLGRVRLEAAKLAIELGQAERDAEEAQRNAEQAKRDAEEARRTAKPRLERRLAEAEHALVEARAEAQRERVARGELERQLESVVQSERAARDQAEEARRKAEQAEAQARAEVTEARAEAKQAQGEAKQVRAEAGQALAKERVERNREQERLVAIEQLMEAASGSQAPDLPSAPDRSAASVQATKPESTTRSRRRRRIFEARGRTCAVCRRMEATSPGQLKARGWALGAEIDLCPECQGEGWQLPKGGSLPFRRSSDRGKTT